MNSLKCTIVVIILLSLNVSYAVSITCGDEGSFMYPYDMTSDGSGGENNFPDCGLCNATEGKWSNKYIPVRGIVTGCGCKSGRYYVKSFNDIFGMAFTCPFCPVGTYKNGVSLVDTCTPIIRTMDSGAESPTDIISSEVATSETDTTLSPIDIVSSEVPTSETDTTFDFPSFIIGSIVGGSVVGCMIIICIQKPFTPRHTNKDLEVALCDSKDTLHDKIDVKITTDANVVKIVDNKTPH